MGVLAPEFGWEAKTGRERVRPERKDGRRDDGGVSGAEGGVQLCLRHNTNGNNAELRR